MTDAPTGAFAPPPSSSLAEPTPHAPDGGNEPEAKQDEQPSVAQQAKDLEGSNTNLHQLSGDPVGDADRFEQQKKNELDEEREEHLRRRAGGGPKE